MLMRLVAYDGNDFVGVLPRPLTINAAFPLNDSSTIQFTYPALSVEYAETDLVLRLLDDELDVALETHRPDGWKEVRGGRFVLLDNANDPTDRTKVHTFIGVGVDWDLDGVVITDPSMYNADGKLAFTDATPGQFLETWHNYGASNGMLSLLTNDFTVDTTSDKQGSATWQSTLTWAVAKDTSYRTVLDTLVGYGLINWCTEGNVLRVFNNGATGQVSDFDGMQVDKTSGPDPVELIVGRECIDGPQQRTRRNMVTDAWIMGDNNAAWLRSSSSFVLKRGRRVTTYSQAGVTTEGAADVIGDKLLAAGQANREQLTRTLRFGNAKFLPFQDYRPGDWILAPGKKGLVEPLRLQQITLTQDEKGNVGGSIILNDRLYERSVAMQRAIDALSNGAAIGGGGGAQPSPLPGRKPARPGGGTSSPGVTGSAYIDNSGHVRAVINVTWPSVSSGTDGTAINVDHYEVRIRKTGN